MLWKGPLSLKAAIIPTQSRFNLTRGSLGSPRSSRVVFGSITADNFFYYEL
ncbi:hypothetical protein LINPERHAP1_LOCUS16060 [Linum perenne]